MTSETGGMLQLQVGSKKTTRQNVMTGKKSWHAMTATIVIYLLTFVYFCDTTSTHTDNFQGTILGSTNQPIFKLHKAFEHSSYGGKILLIALFKFCNFVNLYHLCIILSCVCCLKVDNCMVHLLPV